MAMSRIATNAKLNVVWVSLALLMGAAVALLPLASLRLLMAGAVALAIALLIVAEPSIGIALTLIAGPFGPLEREVLQILPLDSAQILLALTLVAYALRGLWSRSQTSLRSLTSVRHDSRQKNQSHIALFIALALFITIATVSFFQSRSFTDWASELLKWVQLAVLCWLISRERDRRRVWLIIGAILASAALQGGLGVWQYVRGYGPAVFLVPGTAYYRSYGTFQQPNPFGGYMGLIWPFCAGVCVKLIYDFRLKIADGLHAGHMRSIVLALLLVIGSLLAMGLALSGVFTSGSRGARLAAGAALIIMGLAMLPKPGLWIGLAAIVALATVAFNQVPSSVTNTINAFISDYGALDVRGVYLTTLNFSNVERIAHWQAALAMMRDHPWLGIGFGNYDVYYGQYRLLYWENALGHAHNYYLNIFAETGAMGFVAYLGLWITIMAISLRRVRLSPLYIGLLGTWMHLTVHHLFDNLYVANSFLLMGVMLGLLVNRHLVTRHL